MLTSGSPPVSSGEREQASIFRPLNQFLTLLIQLIFDILQWFFVYLSLSPLQRIFRTDLFYPIEDQIVSSTTRVIFTRSKRTNQQICLKLWQRYDEKVFKDKLVTRRVDYLLQGLKFNRQFAPGVYLGIAPVKLSEKPKKIRRGRLIRKPEKDQLKARVEYALIMKCLNNHWRLDYQMRHRKLGTQEGMEFLAKEVACMHRQLDKSPGDKGRPERIYSKMALNRGLFEKALNQMKVAHDLDNVEKYQWISTLIDRACEAYTRLFKRRHEKGCIKRCHGDLKATNLWIRPERSLAFGLRKSPQELLALDCVDFNPEFCHIDTLSDVAMLAIDIEMHLTNWSDKSADGRDGEGLARHFLDIYLREMREDSEAAWPLLEYYMTEKSMICTYVSILYDNQPELGKQYLNIALVHAQRLKKQPASIGKVLRKTTSPLVTHSR